MILYCYNESGIYVGPVSPALSPARPFIDGKPNYVIPSKSTDQAPPACGTFETAVFDGERWVTYEDYRGSTVYSTADGSTSVVSSIGPIPSGYTLIERPSRSHVWDGSAWVVPLVTVKADGYSTIDTKAEELRLTCITGGAGQALAYKQKEDQARAFLVDTEGNRTAEKYPFIFGEAGITAPTALEVAQIIATVSTLWWAFGAAIESVRLGTKQQISQAITADQVAAIIAGVTWPTAPGV